MPLEDREQEYQQLLQAGYPLEYVSQLRAMEQTPETLQTANQQLLEEREVQAKKEAEDAARSAMAGSFPGGPALGYPTMMMSEALGPMLSTVPTSPPSIDPGRVGAGPAPPAAPPTATYTPPVEVEPTVEEVATQALTDEERMKMQEAEWEVWDEQTAAKQWQAQGSIADLREDASVETNPAYRYTPAEDPDKDVTHEAFKGKHFRGGQRYQPNRGRGVGDAAARNAARGGTGTFSAGRMAPGLNVSSEYVMQNESPAIQRLWFENRSKQLGLDMAEAGLDTERARADLLNAEAEEANLPYEQRIKRQLDSMFQMHDAINDRMMPSIRDQVDKQMALIGTTPKGIEMLQDPATKKAMEEKYFREFQQENFNKMMRMIAAAFAMNINDPQTAGNIAIENQRQSMFGGGGGAIPPTTP